MRPDLLSLTAPLSRLTLDGGCEVTPVFGPAWDRDGRLMALEMLSRLYDPHTGQAIAPDLFFSRAGQYIQLQILRWQLDVLTALRPWCMARQVCMSLNLTRPVARGLLVCSELMQQMVSLSPWLRIEITEQFLLPDLPPGQDPLPDALRRLAPLWLDDFGTGSACLSWVLSGHFEMIKLDRKVFLHLRRMTTGRHYLLSLTALAAEAGARVLAEGVSNDAGWRFARDCGVSVCQGWRWAEVSLAALACLPVALPDSCPVVLP